MASEETSVQQPAEEVQGVHEVDGQANGKQDDVEEVEQGMQELGVSGDAEFALHRACAEGRLDGVREVLSGSLEALETLGCTPIVLAIRNNHHDVVRELLQAGAIVPPPGMTNDQQMLSILYPQPMYGMSMGHFMPQQQFQQQQQQHQPHLDYYGQAPFYPQPAGMHMAYPPHRSRKESEPNLPPMDVAKTIPCRNFPNCKYGNNCAFFHPRPNHFFGQQQPGYGYDAGFQGGYQQGMGYQQSGFQQQQFNPGQQDNQTYQSSAQQSLENSLASLPEQAPAPEIPGSELESAHNDAAAADLTDSQQPAARSSPPHVLSSEPAPFVPAFQQPQASMSPPQPSQFGGSPLSPSMLGASLSSLPSIPPAEQFFAATSPPNAGAFSGLPTQGFAPMQMMPHARRQSFNQFAVPGPNGVKPFGHAKKPSFSGGPRPFGGPKPSGLDFGIWKDGVPPPCAFYLKGKCRNGEMCKFPHVDAEGNDCRHPDIVRGAMAPMPPVGRPPRPPRQFGNFDPMFRQQQMAFLQQQRAAVQQAQNGPAIPAGPSEAESASNGDSTSAPVEESTSASGAGKSAAVPAHPTLPPKPSPAAAATTATAATNVNASALAPVPVLVRSASQPGIQRVHANGFSSRSQSPAPSNVSFHGNGHPRRPNSRPPFAPAMNGHAHAHVNGNGHAGRSESADARQASVGPAKRNQRVPNADEFPALGGPGAGAESKQTSPVARGRTAAEVLSAPAPEKPIVKVTRQASADSKSSEESITMDSDNESDGVIISCKPSNSSASTPAVSGNASPAKRPSVSFANMAGAAAGSAEHAPIAVKA